MTATSERFVPIYPGSRHWTRISSGNEPVEWFNPSFVTEQVTSSGQAVPEDPVPTLDELLEDRRIASALLVIQAAASRAFGEALGTVEPRVESDDVLGGVHLLVEVPVSGLERSKYKELRQHFDDAVRTSLEADQLARVVWASRLDA